MLPLFKSSFTSVRIRTVKNYVPITKNKFKIFKSFKLGRGVGVVEWGRVGEGGGVGV